MIIVDGFYVTRDLIPICIAGASVDINNTRLACGGNGDGSRSAACVGVARSGFSRGIVVNLILDIRNADQLLSAISGQAEANFILCRVGKRILVRAAVNGKLPVG